MRRMQGIALDAGRRKLPQYISHVLGWTRNSAQRRRIYRGDLDAGIQPGLKFGRRQMDNSHGAGRQFLKQSPASCHDLDRVLQRQNTGQMRSHVLTNAVADHRFGGNAPMHPQLRKCVFDAEQCRLGESGPTERSSAIIAEHQIPNIQTEMRCQQRRAAIDRRAIESFRAIQPRSHPRVLTALTTEQEGDLPGTALMDGGPAGRPLGLAQHLYCLFAILCHNGSPVREASAPDLQRPCCIRKRQVRLRLKTGSEIGGSLLKRRSCLGRQHQQMVIPHRRRWRDRRSFLEHHMGIRSADAE